jgi:hypothetical protein
MTARQRLRGWAAAVIGLGLLLAVFGLLGARAAAEAPAAPIGSAVCGGCHAEQARRWAGSHHAQALQPATPQTVLGAFGSAERPVSFESGGQRTEFLRRDGQYRVRTEGADGQRREYTIAHTIGVDPLQQYLVTLPDGRLQTLGVAWDARPRSAGGQRWFHLYPDDPPRPGEPTHWSGRAQTGNVMCASCHTTGLRKGYDAAADRYASRWDEPGVGCEACHGAGSRHVAWAHSQRRGHDPAKGFARPVAVLKPPAFAFQAGTVRPIAVNQGTAAQGQAAGEVCSGCHARRSELVAPLDAQAALLDQYRPSLIEPGLYQPDGRIDGEVFEFGSFVQSAMHRAGVSCSHCHDSHDGGLRAPGNALCGQCHQAGHYDRQAHHGQDPASPAAQCVSCHMPSRTYMGVHVRHDHSLRVPGAGLGPSAFARASALAASAGRTARHWRRRGRIRMGCCGSARRWHSAGCRHARR